MNTKYFSENEIACRCGCGFNTISANLAWFMDEVRERYGKPLTVSCVCRCKKHNEEVGGEPNSAHTPEGGVGDAVDFLPPNSHERWNIVNIVVALGVKRYGVYETKFTVHADVRATLPQEVMWVNK